jgi:hypothetical protein
MPSFANANLIENYVVKNLFLKTVPCQTGEQPKQPAALPIS